MRYTKPHFYDTFECLADRCPDTCCAGWQIVIDEDSLEKYEQVEGPFGNRLANSIDWEEGTFLQYERERRCAFLNEQNFCDIYTELNKDALCDTCRMYPRHVEEYDGLREMSLSLSCPEAARIMLTCEEPVRFVTWETDEEEDDFDEDEMDFLLFTRLEDAREVMFQILQERRLDIRERMMQVEMLAEKIQQCVDEYRDFEIDDVIAEAEKRLQESIDEKNRQAHQGENCLQVQDVAAQDVTVQEPRICGEDNVDNHLDTKDHDESHEISVDEEIYHHFCQEFAVFDEMELLRDEWGTMLADMWSALYEGGAEHYREICRRFDTTYGCDSPYSKRWQQIGEQLMIFFVHTYFCGAVYDEWIAVKIRLAAFSVRWIQELVRYRWLKNGETLTMDDVIEMSWRYAREVEHSEDNLEILEEWLQENHDA